MKNFLIVGNWKMNPESIEGAIAIFSAILNELKKEKLELPEIVICPPFLYIEELSKKSSFSKIKIGAQNCFWEEKGSFTGEISPLMLKNAKCSYVIVGHSERRMYLKENNDAILKKIKSSLKLGLKVILCIGETEEEKKEEKTFEIIKNQILETIGKLTKKEKITNILVAYEPIWAIGTGNNCNPNEAMIVATFIKKELLKITQNSVANKIKILYGGSVDSKNAKDYIENGFDGLLIGGASLRPGEFLKIIKNILNFSRNNFCEKK